MSDNSRTPSVGASHSEDRSYNSNDSDGSVHRSSSSSESSSSAGSHSSCTSHGGRTANAPRTEGGDRLDRVDEVAEINPLVSEPQITFRDGSNEASEPNVDGEQVDINERALVCAEPGFARDQSVRPGVGFDPAFYPEEVKLEETVFEGAVGDVLGPCGPSSSQMPRRSLLDDASLDCILARAFPASSPRRRKRGPSKRRAPRKTSGGRTSKRADPVPPGSTLCTADSLEELRTCFRVSEEVELILPASHQRADNPPEGCLTLYESFFYGTYLWFPIPSLILHFLGKYGLSIGQILPRGMRHLVGLIVLSFEVGVQLGVHHLQNLLEIRPSGKNTLRYYISNKKNKKIFDDFPNKDEGWNNHFFFVPINDASVGGVPRKFVKQEWRPIGSRDEVTSSTFLIIIVI